MSIFSSSPSTPDPTEAQSLPEWRQRVLDWTLRGMFLFWLPIFFSGVYNVVETYQVEALTTHWALEKALGIISAYTVVLLLFLIITLKPALGYNLRATLMLILLYIAGSLGLGLSSLSGDGRVFLFAVVVLASILFDLRASLVTFAVSLVTLILFGYLQVTGVIVVPEGRQINSIDASAWISGTTVFVVLSIASLISITYLLRTLGRSLEATRETLIREQRLTRTLRTLSNINQLIVREQNSSQLLNKACHELISSHGYSFVWIGLIDTDGVTLKLAASAGDESVGSDLFTTRIDKHEGLPCALLALQKGQPLEISSAHQANLCHACPRPDRHPQQASFSFPIHRESKTLGVMVVEHSVSADIFFDEEIKLLSELADDIGYALEKIEADQRLKLHNQHQTLLAELTRISLQTTDMTSMLNSMADHLRTTYAADGCYITLWDASQNMPMPAAASGHLSEEFFQVRATEDEVRVSEALRNTRVIVAVEDVRSDPRISERIARMLSVRSLLSAPMIFNGTNLGVIFLGFQNQRSFSTDEICYIGQVADQMALAVENTNLYSRTERSEAYFRALSENSAEGVALIDVNSIFKYITPTEEKILGYDPSFVKGKYAFDIAHPEDRAGAEAALRRSIQYPEELVLVEYRAQRADGSWRHLEVSLKNLLHEPNIQGIVCNFRDVTEKKQTTEAIAQREAYFRALIENSAEGVVIVDTEGRMRYVAPSESKLTGYDAESSVGKEIFTHIHPDDIPAVQIALEEGLHNPGIARVVQYRIQRKDGEWRYFEATGHSMIDDPHVAGIVINYRDITERKQAEQAIEKHAEMLTQAYDNTLAGWARALELRDELTEGHTRRVTELTLELARTMHIPENELAHIRRGALLHDIGKMGIPDSILHKPGALTASEQRIMQLHPQYAYEMMSLIPFLSSALDIPYCHHEKWDGSGYPRGLMGEEIPLAARIFAVVDVWDAVTTDRPYRKAWSREKARAHIIKNSGAYFDPAIVEKFLTLIDKKQL
jgi:PAS domain S-box-containing protein